MAIDKVTVLGVVVVVTGDVDEEAVIMEAQVHAAD